MDSYDDMANFDLSDIKDYYNKINKDEVNCMIVSTFNITITLFSRATCCIIYLADTVIMTLVKPSANKMFAYWY